MYLKDWYAKRDMFSEAYKASGYVYDNPKFHDGDHIHTSKIKSLEFKDGRLFAHTLNSVYELKNICVYADKETLRSMLRFFDLDDKWEYLYEESQKHFAKTNNSLSAKADTPESKLLVEYGRYFSTNSKTKNEEHLSRLSDMASEIPDNTLMLAAGSDYSIVEYGIYKNFDGRLVTVDTELHMGMFQDSVLLSAFCGNSFMSKFFAGYQDGSDEAASFKNESTSLQEPIIISRFFPMGSYMEFYHSIYETDDEYAPRIVILNRREDHLGVRFTNSSKVYVCVSGGAVCNFEG